MVTACMAGPALAAFLAGLDYCDRGLVGRRLAYRLTGLIEGVEVIAGNGGAPERGIYNYLTVPV